LVSTINYQTIQERVLPVLKLGLLFFMLIPFSCFSQWTPSEKAMKKTELLVQKVFKIDFSKAVTSLSSNYYELSSNDSIIGYVCFEQAPSKHDMFDFAAIYSRDMKLLKLQILAYRENYGGEIANKRWLNQFVSRPMEKVQAISGATISVDSMKMAVSLLNQKMIDWQNTL
jgi:hypothetical protein